jgi:histidinol dehydrogenase
MRIVTAAEARETLLRRAPLDEPDLPSPVRETIRRVFGAELDAGAVVDRILRDVRSEGDAAIRRYDEGIDGVRSNAPLEVSADEIQAAYQQVDPKLVGALKTAASRITDYHTLQLKHAARTFEANGLGQVVRPIERVGLYVPGNKVVYPSTLLMTAIPARVAGVRDLIVVTPAREDGTVEQIKLVAADIARVDRVFRAGGVQGIAAMTYGTESVPIVDKICGPGGIFVTIAKRRLFGEVGIDGIFGPSETLVVADEDADPRLVAADMLAGAEHDELATALLLTDSRELAEQVAAVVEAQVQSIGRKDVIRTSLDARGGAIIASSIEAAVAIASEFAAEHVCLHVKNAERHLDDIRNAGCVFAGEYSVESVGDYTAGPSHVMPTGGSARFSSALGVHDFLKVTSLVRLDSETVREIGPAAVQIGYAEGLSGHARAVESRLTQ